MPHFTQPSADDVQFRVAFSHVTGIGPARMAGLERFFDGLEDAWQADRSQLRQAGLDNRTVDEIETTRATLDPAEAYQRTLEAGIAALKPDDDEYPRRLREIPDPPPLLYVRGELLERDEWSLAVVGTRRPTPYGVQATRSLAADLAAAGLTIVSGLARGVDGIAHETTLDQNGRTLAVVASGLDHVYPPEHKPLAGRILDSGGAMLSEYPLGKRPDARYFPRRNRIIAGMTLGTLVTEAGEKSGTWHTVTSALDQGREVFAVPGPITSEQSAGANNVIKRGLGKLVTCAQDVLDELNLGPIERQAELVEQLPEDPMEALLLERLGSEPIHVDELSRLIQQPVHETAAAMATLELKGFIHQVGPMTYARR
ncbi:MAG: DNA-processing protein DprA [Chloroflexota bacterium]|nr:DNA-processing protein DprA [Chloroflexota bacterium]